MNTYYKIYAIFDKKTDDICYVGITKNKLKYRLANHKKSKKSAAYAYMHFHGIDNFDIKLLETVKNDKELGFKREIYWTQFYSQFYQLQNKVLGNSHKFKENKQIKTNRDKINVVLLNNETHYFLEDAAKCFNVSEQSIVDVCFGKRKNDHGRIWCFKEEYEKLSEKEIYEKIMASHSRLNENAIICLTNKRIFYDINEASKITKINCNNICESIQKNRPCKFIENVPIIFKQADRFSIMIEMFKIFLITKNNRPLIVSMTRGSFNKSSILTKIKNFYKLEDDCYSVKLLKVCYDYSLAKDYVNYFIKIYSKKFDLMSKLPIDEKIKKLIYKEKISFNPKHILNATTGEVFANAKQASKHYHLRENNILLNCFNRTLYCGITSNNERMNWEFTKKDVTVNVDRIRKTKNINTNYFLYHIVYQNQVIYVGISNKQLDCLNINSSVDKFVENFDCSFKIIQYFTSKQEAIKAQIEDIKNHNNSFNTKHGRNYLNHLLKDSLEEKIILIKNKITHENIYVFSCKSNIIKHFHTNLSLLKLNKDDFIYEIVDYVNKKEAIEKLKPIYNKNINQDILLEVRKQLKLDIKKNRHVKCVELNLVFENLKKASFYMKCKTFHIGLHLYDLKDYAFTLKENHLHLHWVFTDEEANIFPSKTNRFDHNLLLIRKDKKERN